VGRDRKAVGHKLKSRLDADASRCAPGEDLADGFDCFEIRADGELDPCPLGGRAVGLDHGLGVSPARTRPQPRASRTRLRMRPVWFVSIVSPDSDAYVSRSSRWRLLSFVGTATFTRTCRSPRMPVRRRCGTPRPR